MKKLVMSTIPPQEIAKAEEKTNAVARMPEITNFFILHSPLKLLSY